MLQNKWNKNSAVDIGKIKEKQKSIDEEHKV